MESLVSIIIPAYNNGQYLPEALDSVIAQTYPHWECIVVDDGSTDNTREVAQLYCTKDSRISYLYQENAGPSVARNNGIAHTSGHYILPLDSDDKIADTYLEKAVAYFEAHPETKLVYSRTELFGAENGEFDIAPYYYNDFIYQNCIVCTAMYKRSDYNKTTGYNPNMTHGLEDWDFWLTLLDSQSIVYRIDEVLFYYRIKESSRNTNCTQNYVNLMRIQIIYNHPEIYNIGKLFNNSIELEKRRNEFKAIRNSHAYRLGKILLRPFSKLKNPRT